MSIKPIYADRIISRSKRYEFRRRIFAKNVDVVVIYSSSPVGKVVAEFDIDNILFSPIDDLWSATFKFAGISQDEFRSYFRGKDYGYAIQIGNVRKYPKAFCPIEAFGLQPPQSFAYVDFIDARYCIQDNEPAHNGIDGTSRGVPHIK